jgi:ubiquinone/menaquinone biosynthesis C-methylase UbiE
MYEALRKKEERKYNDLHKMSGFEELQAGWGRQLKLFLNSEMNFYQMARESARLDSVLEIGIGAGEMTRWFVENLQDTASIDVSDYAVNSVREILKTDRIVHCSAESLSFQDNRFNVVFHLDGMEHIPAEIEKQALIEAVRVTRPGGRIYYANACCDSWWDHKLVEMGHDPAHVNIKTPNEWHKFYADNTHDSCKIINREVIGDTVYIVLEKKWPAS